MNPVAAGYTVRWPTIRDVNRPVGTKTLRYLYDFGDGREHTIEIERVIGAVSGGA